MENFSTTNSSSKIKKQNKDNNWVSLKQESDQDRKQSIQSHKQMGPFKSNEIIRQIHTVNRKKRNLKGIIEDETGHQGMMEPELWNNPIEILRQERLKRERARKNRILKEKERLKMLDIEEIR